MPITVDATWIVGILLAVIRVAAFAVASPILARVMPKVGRGAFAIAVALALARPIAHVPDPKGGPMASREEETRTPTDLGERVIDVHHHWLPPELVDRLERYLPPGYRAERRDKEPGRIGRSGRRVKRGVPPPSC